MIQTTYLYLDRFYLDRLIIYVYNLNHNLIRIQSELNPTLKSIIKNVYEIKILYHKNIYGFMT